MSTGEAFARAVAAGDRESLSKLLAPELAFRALTPSRFWESESAGEVVETMLATWFGGERHIDAVEHIECDRVGDLERVGYRFRATTPDGATTVEQQAYLAVDGGRITSLRILCSGFRPAPQVLHAQ